MAHAAPPDRSPRLVEEKVWTAEEFERLSPPEQDTIFVQSIATDLTVVPQQFLASVLQRPQAPTRAVS